MKWILIGSAISFLYGAYWIGSNLFFLETAPYQVIHSEGAFDIREYPDLAVVRTEMKSNDSDPAFRKLFRFIQGENSLDQKIAMTTPVFIDKTSQEEAMSFVVPEETRRSEVPQPTVPAVAVETREATRVAVYRFSGKATEKVRDEAVAKLRNWMQKQGLESTGEITLAYYDAPFVPGPLRRNEVMLRIEK